MVEEKRCEAMCVTAKEVISKQAADLKKELVGRTIVGVDGVMKYDDEVILYLELDNGKRAYIVKDKKCENAGHLDVEEVT